MGTAVRNGEERADGRWEKMGEGWDWVEKSIQLNNALSKESTPGMKLEWNRICCPSRINSHFVVFFMAFFETLSLKCIDFLFSSWIADYCAETKTSKEKHIITVHKRCRESTNEMILGVYVCEITDYVVFWRKENLSHDFAQIMSLQSAFSHVESSSKMKLQELFY